MRPAIPRLKHLFLAIAILAPTQATWTNLTLSDYKLKQSSYSAAIANLDKTLPNVKVSDIMADLNHVNPSASPNIKHLVASSAYSWESSSDFNDQDTTKWYPQGITTSADASASGEYEGHRVQLVTWHSDNYQSGKRGARLSFVSQGGKTKKYRHVLLVQPKGDDDFKAIEGLHAGGVAWYGNLVYVVDTHGGLRVFDLNHLYKVDGSIRDKAGKQGSAYGAYGYKYILSQVRTYNWQSHASVSALRFSFISLDRTTTPNSLLIGEYQTSCTACRLIRWNVDSQTRLLTTSADGVATASQALSHGNDKIQGAASVNGKFFLTQSPLSGARANLITWSSAEGKKTAAGVFSKVPEDLSYEEGVGLWTLMEEQGARSVFAVDTGKL